MQRDVFVRTPENVVFGFRLAGLGSRMTAAFVDYAIVGAIAGLLVSGLLFVAGVVGLTMPGIGGFASAGVIAVLLVMLFTLVFGYFLFFELIWNGQTPGKRAVGIRVVKDLGQGITFVDSLVRNLVRIADILPGVYGFGGLVTLLSARNKRLGDHAAGTVVVAVEKNEAPAPLDEKWERHNSLQEDATLAARIRQEITPEETELVRDVWARREALSATARATLIARIAGHLRRRLSIPRIAHLSDEQMLRDVLEIVLRPGARA